MNEHLTEMNPHNIYMPSWVKPRLTGDWQYAGVIDKNPFRGTFEELVVRTLHSDHGEIREVDHYEQGAACWFKEREEDNDQ